MLFILEMALMRWVQQLQGQYNGNEDVVESVFQIWQNSLTSKCTATLFTFSSDERAQAII